MYKLYMLMFLDGFSYSTMSIYKENLQMEPISEVTEFSEFVKYNRFLSAIISVFFILSWVHGVMYMEGDCHC